MGYRSTSSVAEHTVSPKTQSLAALGDRVLSRLSRSGSTPEETTNGKSEDSRKEDLHSRKLTWNLTVGPGKRTVVYKGPFFRFHLTFRSIRLRGSQTG